VDRLDNRVRPYAWGSVADIPEFLGVPAGLQPSAELWMGAHPDLPSQVTRAGAQRSLADLIAADPEAALGPEVASRFGPRLPFLLKVLSAARPLSLQVHPDKQYAERAYAAQRQDPGAEPDYTDDNHKPELICALRDGFAGLAGFRPLAGTASLLAELAVPGLAELAAGLDQGDQAGSLRATVTGLLTNGEDRTALIEAVRLACERVAGTAGPWAAAGAGYAVVAAAYPADPGVLVALLLNYVELAEGEAVFIAAGVPHCYLHGFGAEIMASSDNVLRAGLTPKRVNVPELLRVLDFHPAEPAVLRAVPAGAGAGDADGEPGAVYPAPVADFRLSRLDLAEDPIRLPGGRPQILLSIGGSARARDQRGEVLELRRGDSVFVPAADGDVTLTGSGTVLRATVGLPGRQAARL
jgi:mannose-6-phosphate isomerase